MNGQTLPGAWKRCQVLTQRGGSAVCLARARDGNGDAAGAPMNGWWVGEWLIGGLIVVELGVNYLFLAVDDA